MTFSGQGRFLKQNECKLYLWLARTGSSKMQTPLQEYKGVFWKREKTKKRNLGHITCFGRQPVQLNKAYTDSIIYVSFKTQE